MTRRNPLFSGISVIGLLWLITLFFIPSCSVLGFLVWPCERMVGSKRPTPHSLPPLWGSKDGEGQWCLTCFHLTIKHLSHKFWTPSETDRLKQGTENCCISLVISCPCTKMYKGYHEFMYHIVSPATSWCCGVWYPFSF